MSDDDDDDDDTSYEREGWDICYCGCTRGEHNATGRCDYCFDCDGFTLDEDATLMATIGQEDIP
jgi:hypothetical protein